MKQRTDKGFGTLLIEARHLPPLLELPFHHRDPFDRLLVCQAAAERMPVYTADPIFDRYAIERVW